MDMSIKDATAAAVVVSALEGKAPTRSSQPTKSDTSSAQVVDYKPKSTAKDLSSTQTVNSLSPYGEETQDDTESQLQNLQIDEEFVQTLTDELNDLMSKTNLDINFKWNKEANIMTVKMVDSKTDEVIREYPPEEMVEGMLKAREWIGAFIDEHA